MLITICLSFCVFVFCVLCVYELRNNNYYLPAGGGRAMEPAVYADVHAVQKRKEGFQTRLFCWVITCWLAHNEYQMILVS